MDGGIELYLSSMICLWLYRQSAVGGTGPEDSVRLTNNITSREIETVQMCDSFLGIIRALVYLYISLLSMETQVAEGVTDNIRCSFRP
jgi:hypothetical protein